MLLRVRTGEGKTFKVINSMSVYVLSNHPSPLFAFKYKRNIWRRDICMQARCVVYHQIYSTQLETMWIYSTDSIFCQYRVDLDWPILAQASGAIWAQLPVTHLTHQFIKYVLKHCLDLTPSPVFRQQEVIWQHFIWKHSVYQTT